MFTRRELEIARLVAEGLTCSEAAQKISRSPRTVENHLRAVYRKLGVRNRVEMLRALERHGLHEPDSPSNAEIELKGHALELIQRIDQRLASLDNHSYFGGLALALAEAFGTRWAGVTETTSHGDMLDIIAFAADGRIAEFIQCSAQASPCGQALDTGECIVWEKLAEMFPEDREVVECQAASYVGVRLDDRLMGPVGTMWIMHDKPVDQSLLPVQVLRVIAPRAAAELALAKALDRVDEDTTSG